MQITLNRLTSNRLYTEGQLRINGETQTHTVEPSDIMLPVGHYTLALVKKNAHCRELVVQNTPWRIGIAHSFIGSRKEKMIAIGSPLIPGAVYKSTPDYERIIKRLEKCQDRKETIDLIIEDSHCRPNRPISHWLTPCLFLLLFLGLMSCGIQRPLQVVTQVQKDTIYLNKVQYDSIYVQNDHSLEFHPSTLNSQPSTIVDTIFIKDKSIEYKYRLLRDTVRIHQIDSIPVIREVEVVKTERYVPGIYKWSLAICITLIVLLILYVLWKLK